MPTTPQGFTKRLERLRADLAEQGARVRSIVEAAFDATLARDPVRAAIVKAQDDVIDRVDVEVEKAAVALLTNSVQGILRDAVRAFNRSDPALAKVVLQSEDAVEAFLESVLKDAERRIASGAMSVDFAFSLHQIANECCVVADHATNMCEQVIYAVTGAIVRHQQGGWVEVPRSA